jgi:hypothetical protein
MSSLVGECGVGTRRSLYALVSLSMLWTGCIGIAENDRAQAAIEGAQLVYFRDSRTGLCFAGRYLNFTQAVLTNVPCTETVQQVIASQVPSVSPRADESSQGNHTGATYSR